MATVFRSSNPDFVADYELTTKDLLLLGVAAYGETRGSARPDEWGAMMWTWLYRFMTHGPRPRPWPTLADCIINHSQPVNPSWRRNGTHCAGKTSGNCAPNLLAWRDKMADYISRGQIPAAVAPTVTQFALGLVPQPPGGPYYDFAATAGAKKLGTKLYDKGSWFLTKEQMLGSSLLQDFHPGVLTPWVDGVPVNPSGAGTGLLIVATGLLALATAFLVKYLEERGNK